MQLSLHSTRQKKAWIYLPSDVGLILGSADKAEISVLDWKLEYRDSLSRITCFFVAMFNQYFSFRLRSAHLKCTMWASSDTLFLYFFCLDKQLQQNLCFYCFFFQVRSRPVRNYFWFTKHKINKLQQTLAQCFPPHCILFDSASILIFYLFPLCNISAHSSHPPLSQPPLSFFGLCVCLPRSSRLNIVSVLRQRNYVHVG